MCETYIGILESESSTLTQLQVSFLSQIIYGSELCCFRTHFALYIFNVFLKRFCQFRYSFLQTFQSLCQATNVDLGESETAQIYSTIKPLLQISSFYYRSTKGPSRCRNCIDSETSINIFIIFSETNLRWAEKL